MAEAGGTVAGGHTIRNPEPIFGLAVQGVVDPARVFRKSGARPGDVLVLSKPIGTALALAGGSPDDKAAAIAGMRRLNRAAAEELLHRSTARCTRSPTSPATASPATAGRWPSAAACASSSTPRRSARTPGPLPPPSVACAPAATRATATTSPAHLESTAAAGPEALCMDPQTSGGLLAAVDPAVVGRLSEMWWRAGEVAAGPAAIVLR